MNIGIGGDHASVQYKSSIITLLEEMGHDVTNYGANNEDSVDYTDHIHPVAIGVQSEKYDLGIIICGSGNGAAMTANKHQGIRAALCWNKEMTVLARSHNNANILSLPARFISEHQAIDMVKTFLDTPFDGGRHQLRIDKIPCK